jgi:hypothetical protein
MKQEKKNPCIAEEASGGQGERGERAHFEKRFPLSPFPLIPSHPPKLFGGASARSKVNEEISFFLQVGFPTVIHKGLYQITSPYAS